MEGAWPAFKRGVAWMEGARLAFCLQMRGVA